MFRVSRKNQRLWHRVQPLLPGRHHVRSIITLPPGQAESARDKSYLTWANLLLGALYSTLNWNRHSCYHSFTTTYRYTSSKSRT
jgi:hypothetical protein